MTAKSFSVNAVKCLDFDEVISTQNNKSGAEQRKGLEGQRFGDIYWASVAHFIGTRGDSKTIQTKTFQILIKLRSPGTLN